MNISEITSTITVIETLSLYSEALMVKFCSFCKCEFELSEANFSRRTKGGYWASECRRCAVKRAKQWSIENREKFNARMRKHGANYRIKHAETLRAARKVQYQHRMANGRFRAITSVSTGIHQSLRKGKDGYLWEARLGYARVALIAHLERQFTKRMNWNNYGSYWHIDHIRPIRSFEFDSMESPQFVECWSLSNLRPLPKSENLAKSSRRLLLV